jgi:radical SAM protein with 4Fe4S-binding SPASM domain
MYSRSAYHHTDDLFNHPGSYSWLQEQVGLLRQEFPDDDIRVQGGEPQLRPPSAEARSQAWRDRSACTAGRQALVMCADGKVIPCLQMRECEEHYCGDLRHQSIQEVWDGERLRELTYGISRDKFRGTPCFDCEERHSCLDLVGNCVRDLYGRYGSIYQPAPDCPRNTKAYVRKV